MATDTAGPFALGFAARFRRASQVTVLGVVALIGVSSSALCDERILPLDRVLSFTDADGHAVTSKDFAGKWLLVYFGYTHCADFCPTSLSVMVAALDEIGPAAGYIVPLFVTVDPDRDKGQVLRTFTESFDKRMVGLGGSMGEVRDAAKTLGASFEKVFQGDAYSVDHTTDFFLIDPAQTRTVAIRVAEPHLLAARLIRALSDAHVSLEGVHNLGAFR